MSPDSIAGRAGEGTRVSRGFSLPPVARILVGIALGVVAGLLFGDAAKPLGRVGTTILDVIRGLAGPLLFFAILDAFLRSEIRRADAGRMLGIAAINASLAILIGLGGSNLFHPGRGFLAEADPANRAVQVEFRQMASRVEPGRTIDVIGELLSYLPTSLVRPFLDNAVISIAILAVGFGVAARRAGHRLDREGVVGFSIVTGLVTLVYEVFTTLLGWVMTLIPIAVFALVARAVGGHGLKAFAGLVPYLAVGIGGLLIQVAVVYQIWIALVARRSLRWFWGQARVAVTTAFGTGSSLATLPVTLRTLDEMKVSPRSARLAACVGTNLNNDGILLYEAMAVLFVAQAAGFNLDLTQQALISVSCLIAGMGISGIPDAGLISLLIVLKTAKLPDDTVAQVVPFLLAVDWLIGRCRAATNVVSDLLVALVLDTYSEPVSEPQQRQGNDPSGI